MAHHEFNMPITEAQARAVRVNGAFDLQASRATLANGELTVVLPKLTDRRGQGHAIPVSGT